MSPRRNPAEPGYYLRRLTRAVDEVAAAVDRATVELPGTTTPEGGGNGQPGSTQRIARAARNPRIIEYTPAPIGTKVLTVPLSTQAKRDPAHPTVLIFPLV